jgi:hypothetical protein
VFSSAVIRGPIRVIRVPVSPLLLLLLLPGPVAAQVAPSVTLDRQAVRLSEPVRVTLAVEGPAPLRVEPPADDQAQKLLTPESAAAWRIRPAGGVTVEDLPGGRQRWARVYRLDPYLAGEKVPVAFAPVPVAAGGAAAQPVTWPSQEVAVTTTIAEPKAEHARPVTGIEELPPLPGPDPGAVGWWFAAGLGAVFGAVLGWVVVRRWRAGPPPLPPAVWATRELDRLAREVTAGRAAGAADRVAAVVRGYVERRHGLPASRRTTAELVAACDGAGWPAEGVAGLRDLLGRCDRTRFAGGEPTAAEAGELIAAARAWVAAGGGPADPGPGSPGRP